MPWLSHKNHITGGNIVENGKPKKQKFSVEAKEWYRKPTDK